MLTVYNSVIPAIRKALGLTEVNMSTSGDFTVDVNQIEILAREKWALPTSALTMFKPLFAMSWSSENRVLVFLYGAAEGLEWVSESAENIRREARATI